MSIEAMKQALEVFEDFVDDPRAQKEINEASTALRQAIAEADKQEPFGYFRYDLRLDAWVQNRESDQGTPFYTNPQPKREWVGLTDEDFQPMVHKAMMYYGYDPKHSTLTSGAGFYELVRAIEAKLKEKNI